MMGCYNSLANTHRVHDISPILPHVVADSTWSHYTFSQGRLTWQPGNRGSSGHRNREILVVGTLWTVGTEGTLGNIGTEGTLGKIGTEGTWVTHL